jgi:hypothetical protein
MVLATVVLSLSLLAGPPDTLVVADPPAQLRPRAERGREVATWLGGGFVFGGALSVGVGIGFFIARNFMELDAQITEHELQRLELQGPPDAYVSTYYELETQRSIVARRQRVSTIGFIVGGCAVALGIGLIGIDYLPRRVAFDHGGLTFRF